MDIGVVSMRYARALMSFAQDTKSEEALYPAMEMLEYSLRHNRGLRAEVGNPMLTEEQRLGFICAAAYGKDTPDDSFVKFIRLVIRNGREDMLQFICRDYMDLYRRHHNMGTAKLTTAFPISKEKLDEIDKLTGNLLHTHMEVESEVNPDIIGGFIFDILDYRLDASVATQLRKIGQQFLDMNKRVV